MMRTRRFGRMAAAVAATALAVVPALVSPSPAQAGSPASLPNDAMVFLPYSGGPAVVRLGNQQQTLAVPRFDQYARTISGRFDGSNGAGVFIYGGAGKRSGTLRVRNVAGQLQLSFRREVVNGAYDNVAGDFNGDGITDILWLPACCDPGPKRPYIWYFHENATHTSVPFSIGDRANVADGPRAVADLDGNGRDDLIWAWEGEVWLMRPGGYTVKSIDEMNKTGLSDVLPASLTVASDDARRISLIFQGAGETLLTFDDSGNHRAQVIRAQAPPDQCCTYQGAFSGHFRAGRADSLFFYDYHRARLEEHMEDFDADGTMHEVDVQQVKGAYWTRVGDYDGNGFDDILWYSRSGGSSIWWSTGTGFTWTSPPGIPVSSRPLSVHLLGAEA